MYNLVRNLFISVVIAQALLFVPFVDVYAVQAATLGETSAGTRSPEKDLEKTGRIDFENRISNIRDYVIDDNAEFAYILTENFDERLFEIRKINLDDSEIEKLLSFPFQNFEDYGVGTTEMVLDSVNNIMIVKYEYWDNSSTEAVVSQIDLNSNSYIGDWNLPAEYSENNQYENIRAISVNPNSKMAYIWATNSNHSNYQFDLIEYNYDLNEVNKTRQFETNFQLLTAKLNLDKDLMAIYDSYHHKIYQIKLIDFTDAAVTYTLSDEQHVHANIAAFDDDLEKVLFIGGNNCSQTQTEANFRILDLANFDLISGGTIDDEDACFKNSGGPDYKNLIFGGDLSAIFSSYNYESGLGYEVLKRLDFSNNTAVKTNEFGFGENYYYFDKLIYNKNLNNFFGLLSNSSQYEVFGYQFNETVNKILEVDIGRGIEALVKGVTDKVSEYYYLLAEAGNETQVLKINLDDFSHEDTIRLNGRSSYWIWYFEDQNHVITAYLDYSTDNYILVKIDLDNFTFTTKDTGVKASASTHTTFYDKNNNKLVLPINYEEGGVNNLGIIEIDPVDLSFEIDMVSQNLNLSLFSSDVDEINRIMYASSNEAEIAKIDLKTKQLLDLVNLQSEGIAFFNTTYNPRNETILVQGAELSSTSFSKIIELDSDLEVTRSFETPNSVIYLSYFDKYIQKLYLPLISFVGIEPNFIKFDLATFKIENGIDLLPDEIFSVFPYYDDLRGDFYLSGVNSPVKLLRINRMTPEVLRGNKVELTDAKNEFTDFNLYLHEPNQVRIAMYNDNHNLVWESPLIEADNVESWLQIPVSAGTPNQLKDLPVGEYYLTFYLEKAYNSGSQKAGSNDDGISEIIDISTNMPASLNPQTNNIKWSIFANYSTDQGGNGGNGGDGGNNQNPVNHSGGAGGPFGKEASQGLPQNNLINQNEENTLDQTPLQSTEFNCLAQSNNNFEFSDIDDLGYQKDIINIVKNLNNGEQYFVVTGDGNHSFGETDQKHFFKPFANMTRIAILKTLLVSGCYQIAAEIPDNEISPFLDVNFAKTNDPEQNFSNLVIYSAWKAGILNGYEDRTARPNQLTNNLEIATFLGRSIEKSDSKRFINIENDLSWYGKYLNLMKNNTNIAKYFQVTPKEMMRKDYVETLYEMIIKEQIK